MAKKNKTAADLKAKLTAMTDEQKYGYYGFTNELMIKLIGMSYEVIKQQNIPFDEVGKLLFNAKYKIGGVFTWFNSVRYQMGMLEQHKLNPYMNYFQHIEQMDRFLNYSDIYSR